MDKPEIIFTHDGIWGDDPETWEGIDRPASEARLTQQIKAEFSKLGVIADFAINSTGKSRPHWGSAEEEAAHDQAQEIADRVWSRHQWQVEE